MIWEPGWGASVTVTAVVVHAVKKNVPGQVDVKLTASFWTWGPAEVIELASALDPKNCDIADPVGIKGIHLNHAVVAGVANVIRP